MMSRKAWWAVLAVLAMVAVGCGKPAGNSAGKGEVASADSKAAQDGPAAVVSQFLEAVRTGNDDKATQLLSPVARQKAAEKNRSVTPPPSETARFEIGQIEYITDDGKVVAANDQPANCTGARVACAWTDLDETGKPQTEHALWVVRREAEGWRVVGVAAMVFPGEPPVLLNFEDPEGMEKQQQLLREEIARREKQENSQDLSGKNSPDSIRR